jgi:hypothetical protein
MTTQTTWVRRALLFAALSLAIGLSGCGAPAAQPTASGATSGSSATVARPESNASEAAPQPTEAPKPTATDEPVPTATAEPSPTPAAAGTSRSNPLPLGKEIRLKSWAVTITTVVRGTDAQKAIAGANQFNDPPREGYEYLLATLQLENISEKQEAQPVAFSTSLRLTGNRNISYRSASVVEPKPLEGELFPGGKAEGQIAFEVPSDESNLMFQVAESFSFDDTQYFVAIDQEARITPDAALPDIEATKSGTRRDAPAKPGETVITEDWQVTLIDVMRGPEAAKLVQHANQFNEPAPAGTEYIAVKLRVRSIAQNKPDVAQHVDGSFVKVTGEKNVVYDRPSVVAPSPELDASLFPGGEAEGWEVVSVATGEQKLVLIFEPLFSFSDDDTRFLALE